MNLDTIFEKIQRHLPQSGFTDSLALDCGDAGIITMKDGTASREEQDVACTIKISEANLVKLVQGDLNPMTAFMMGKIKVSGDMSVAMKLGQIMKG